MKNRLNTNSACMKDPGHAEWIIKGAVQYGEQNAYLSTLIWNAS